MDAIKNFNNSFNSDYGWVLHNPNLPSKFVELLNSLGDLDDDTKNDLVTIGLQMALSMSPSKEELMWSLDVFMDMIADVID